MLKQDEKIRAILEHRRALEEKIAEVEAELREQDERLRSLGAECAAEVAEYLGLKVEAAEVGELLMGGHYARLPDIRRDVARLRARFGATIPMNLFVQEINARKTVVRVEVRS